MIFTINYFEVVIVETREADCIFRSVLRGDGGMEVIIIILISIIWRLYFIDIYIICLWNQYKNRSWTKTTRRLWPVFAAGFLVCRKIIFFLSSMMIMIYLWSWHNYDHIHDMIIITMKKLWSCSSYEYVQGWPILRKTASFFLSCTDSVTSKGMRVLYRCYYCNLPDCGLCLTMMTNGAYFQPTWWRP